MKASACTARLTFGGADGVLVTELGLPEQIMELLFNDRVRSHFKGQNQVSLSFLVQLSNGIDKMAVFILTTPASCGCGPAANF
jgi:hypothetical protein